MPDRGIVSRVAARRHACDQTQASRLAQGGRGHALHGERSSYTVLLAERRLWGPTDRTMPGAGDPAMAMNNPDLGLAERLLQGDDEAQICIREANCIIHHGGMRCPEC